MIFWLLTSLAGALIIGMAYGQMLSAFGFIKGDPDRYENWIRRMFIFASVTFVLGCVAEVTL
jgi:hypothetical protein